MSSDTKVLRSRSNLWAGKNIFLIWLTRRRNFPRIFDPKSTWCLIIENRKGWAFSSRLNKYFKMWNDGSLGKIMSAEGISSAAASFISNLSMFKCLTWAFLSLQVKATFHDEGARFLMRTLGFNTEITSRVEIFREFLLCSNVFKTNNSLNSS